MKPVYTRLYCNCGWEQWISFDPKFTNEEINDKTMPIIQEHMKTHGQLLPLKAQHIGHTRIKPLNS